MGFQSKPLARIILATVLGCVASWICLGVLIALSIASPPSQIARGLLLGWILIAACWLAIRASRREPGTTWWQLLLTASAWPAYATISIFWKSARP